MAPLLTNAGRSILTNRIKGSGTEPNNVAWGTGATAEAATQTALVAEIAGGRQVGASTQQTTTVANDTYQVVATMTAGSAVAVTEVGLFDAAAAGNMFIRAVFSVINLSTGDSIQFTIKVVFT